MGGLDGGYISRNNNKRNEWTWTYKLGGRTGQIKGLDKMCLCDEMHNNDLVELLRTCLN